jgi:hypothetical protein
MPLETLPDGTPLWADLNAEPAISIEYLGCIYNGGETFDAYHAGFEVTDRRADADDPIVDRFGLDIGATGNVPNGVCMSTEYFHDHLVEDDPERWSWIEWAALPEPVQNAILGEVELLEWAGVPEFDESEDNDD